MRPKLITLLAVSALVLSGCASNESAAEPKESLAASASPDPTQITNPDSPVTTPETKNTDKPSPSEDAVESEFADFAESRAKVHSAKSPDRELVIQSLHEFCEEGDGFSVSKTRALNDNLENVADRIYCDQLSN